MSKSKKKTEPPETRTPEQEALRISVFEVQRQLCHIDKLTEPERDLLGALHEFINDSKTIAELEEDVKRDKQIEKDLAKRRKK